MDWQLDRITGRALMCRWVCLTDALHRDIRFDWRIHWFIDETEACDMNVTMKLIVTWGVLFQLICLGLVTVTPAWADDCNISATDKYAWSENAGWTNWHDSYACVTVAPTYLAGYVWAENIGWIKLGSDGGGPYNNDAADDWGVNRNSGTGALSGYAWSENAGWINFNPSHSQVTMDTGTGEFDGYAWAENIGYIHFQNSSPEYSVDQEGPLVVELVSFTATGFEDSILLTWHTASEIDNAGFHLWRSETEDGEYVRITDSLIPAQGSPTLGVEYEYEDLDVEPGRTYYYKLEDIDTDGVNTFHTESVILRETASDPEASPASEVGSGGCFINSVTYNH
jgi:hypothetical protein